MNLTYAQSVAPYAGAWIEMTRTWCGYCLITSLPTRERGLKSAIVDTCYRMVEVAPYAGAWIEIGKERLFYC